jgi:riboflavin synthase alpha subunit
MARGVTGNFQSNPRVFAHDALSLITSGATANYVFGDVIPGVEVSGNGVCLYVGKDIATLSVTMETGSDCIFKNLKAGQFIPILVRAVKSVGGQLAEGELVALY